MILELLGLKERAFWRFFTQMTANFVRLVLKKSARYTFPVSVSVTLTQRSTMFKFVDLHYLFFFFYFKVPRLKGPRNFLIWKSRNAHAAACSPLKDKDSFWPLSMIFPRPQNNLCWGHLLLCWTSKRNFFLTVCQIVGQTCLPMIYFRRDFFGLLIIKDAEEFSPAFLRYISLLVCDVCLRERYYI